jgi:hypothetical protein
MAKWQIKLHEEDMNGGNKKYILISGWKASSKGITWGIGVDDSKVKLSLCFN